LSIFLMDDDTNNVFLNWSEVSGATGYYIWYSNNVTWVLQLNETNSTPANQTLIGSTNITWNDTTANLTTRRFYAVASYVGGLKNLSYNRTGKFDIEIENSTNDPSSNEGSIVSFPLGPLNGNLSYVLNLSGAHAFYDRIRIYNSSSSLWIQAEYLGNGIWDNNKFLIEPGRGYWFTKVNGSYNLTNVGIVPRGNLTIFINQSENNPSTKEGSLLGWTLLTDANLSTELNLSGAHAFYDRIRIYNSSSSLWIQAEYLGNGIWDNNKFLIEPGRGYWFTKTNESYNWTQERPV